MTRKEIYHRILQKQSYLCIGLDSDIERIPRHLLSEQDPILAFNKAIIDATKDLCVAYKPNIAFYESLGARGWQTLEKTLEYIPDTHFTIADAKRGDIGNTSRRYASAFFEQMDFDSITIAPYMGEDSVSPFLSFENKWVILLALTSNPGSSNFQKQHLQGHQELYQLVLTEAQKWASPEQLMFVVGATHPEHFAIIRELAPDNFYLVPGVGAQGGDLEAISRYGFNDQVGLLVNSSRGIIYAGTGEDFAEEARKAASHLQLQMAKLLEERFGQ